MDYDTIRAAVRQSLTPERRRMKQSRGRIIQPDEQIAWQMLRRQLEQECSQLEVEIASLKREEEEAAHRAGRIQQQINSLSDGFFGAERLLNRNKLRQLEGELSDARQRAISAGRNIRDRLAHLRQCRETLGNYS